MRFSLLLLVVLGACVADADGPVVTEREDERDIMQPTMGEKDAARIDVCALAAALPDGDICQNVCDPDAMRAQLAAEGGEPGTCYQLYCSLTEIDHVLAGVCLPP